MKKTTLMLALLGLTTTLFVLTPGAEAQYCASGGGRGGEIGFYEGKLYSHYYILNCSMTPVGIFFGEKPQET